MLTVYSSDHHLHRGVELKDGAITDSFENPLRAETVLAQVRAAGLGDVIAPRAFDRASYAGAHSARYVEFLAGAWDEWVASGRTCQALPLVWPVRAMPSAATLPDFIDGKLGFFAMDAGAPINAGTWGAVSASANSALTGADLLSNAGARAAFALCRPPGHHAGREYMGGYCYLNNAAIAVQAMLDAGAKRVAVLDVDYHHGNGTQDIFYDRADVLFTSIHGDPRFEYPYYLGFADEKGVGAGAGFNFNYPLASGIDWSVWSLALADACRQIAEYAPDALVVSLGVDTFKEDPISQFKLDSPDYLRMGEIIGKLGLQTLFVMEGGYAVEEIGINAINVLQGFDSVA